MNDKIITKVQNLLTRAGHPETPEHEREACLAKADELMSKYRIERAMLNLDHSDQAKPIVSQEFSTADFGDFASNLKSIMFAIFKHAGCEPYARWNKMAVVGYEEDIFFGQLLWTEVHREFVSRMFPKWDAWRTFESNVQRIKDSGRSWMEIVHMAPESEGLNANSGSRLRSAYRREYNRLGMEPVKEQTRSPQRFRQSFADSFETRLRDRLRHYAKTSHGDGVSDRVSLALVTDQDRIKQAFYDLFPDMRPKTAEEKAEAARMWRERWDAERKAEAERRAKLTDKQREAEDRAAAREAEKSRRWYEKYERQNRVDPLGAEAGEAAADGVNLERSGKNIGRTDKELA